MRRRPQSLTGSQEIAVVEKELRRLMPTESTATAVVAAVAEPEDTVKTPKSEKTQDGSLAKLVNKISSQLGEIRAQQKKSEEVASVTAETKAIRPNATNSFRPKGRCYNCGKEGHVAKNCRLPTQQTAPRPTFRPAQRPLQRRVQQVGQQRGARPSLLIT